MSVKPCPFCGEAGVDVVETSTFRWRVAQCKHCGAQCGEVRIQTMGDGTPEEWEAVARERAIAEWNTRAVPQPSESTNGVDHAAARERVANLMQRAFPYATVAENKPFVDKLCIAAGIADGSDGVKGTSEGRS